MTNQEKIDELVPIITANGKLLPMCIMSNYQCRSKVMQMAEWKDQQFKKYLEFQKIECLRTAKIVYAYDMSSAGELEIKAKCYDEIINELFPEQEQDNTDREE